MKIKLLSFLCGTVLLAFTACHDDDKSLNVQDLQSTHCKTFTDDAGESFDEMQAFRAEKIVYKAQGGYLHIQHINALHNCYEENKVEISVRTEGDKILIQEIDTNPLANCFCEYDVEYKVGVLTKGKSYVISINETIEFPIVFSATLEGEYPE